MADDSELDYLRTLIGYLTSSSTVKHFSEVKKISLIEDIRRILIFPGEIINFDVKFYTKRYKIQLSDDSEANMTSTLNNIIEGLDIINRGQEEKTYYTETSFDCSSEESIVTDLIWDGTFFWVIGIGTDEVYKYTAAGVYTTTHWDTSSEDGSGYGLAWDGTFFWVSGGVNKRVYKYNAAGTYQSVSFDVSNEDNNPYGITWDGTFFWLVGNDSNKVYKYTAAGVYTGFSFDISDEDTDAHGIGWDGSHLWVAGNDTNTIYKYTTAGVYTGFSIDVSGEDETPVGITWDGSHLWVAGNSDDDVYKYNRSIYTRPSTLVYIELQYGNKAYEHPKTKRWYQDIYLDVEWCIE